MLQRVLFSHRLLFRLGAKMSRSPVPLPDEIFRAAGRGELQQVIKWLRKGGTVDALICGNTRDGRPSTYAMLHIATSNGREEMVRELLERGASINLQNSFGVTALVAAACFGHHSILFLLLQHSANPDLQDIDGFTALMTAAENGRVSCVRELLRAKANTELVDNKGCTALRYAEVNGKKATAEFIRQHAALSQPAATVAPQATQAAVEELLAEGQAPSKTSKKKKKKKKAGHAQAATAAGNEPSEAPPAAAPALPPAAAPEPAASAAERVEAAPRAVIAGGGLVARMMALASSLREVRTEVREGSVGAEARAQRDTLLEAQQAAEREAEQEAAAEATRLAAAVRVREAAAREAERVAAASKAREEAEAAAAAMAAAVEAAAAAEAEANALERATADSGEGSSSGSSEASEAAEVPDDYICPITAEIMTDPVFTMDGFTYERAAITEWLRDGDTSPLTGATLESKRVIPNLTLRSMIRRFTEEQGGRGGFDSLGDGSMPPDAAALAAV